MKTYYVYILTNKNRGVLYIGVSNDISRRHFEHVTRVSKYSFSARYNCNKLVYFEQTESAQVAIQREKQLKSWHREWKISLVEDRNPDWQDLSQEWGREILNQVQDDSVGVQDDNIDVHGGCLGARDDLVGTQSDDKDVLDGSEVIRHTRDTETSSA